MSQLFRLESFFYEKGSRKDDYTEDFELLPEIKRLLLISKNNNQTQKQKNIVLFGESGSDKSLFLIKLMQDIFKDSLFDDYLIIFYKLRDLSGDDESTDK
jgi:DNA replication protein DnaC